MAKKDKIEVGHATDLHFSHAGGAHAGSIRSVLPAKRPAAPKQGRGPGAAAAVAVLLALCVCGGFGAWWFLWRDVHITVNDQEHTVRVGTSLSDFLDDNDSFGAKPGRLLSISGAVLSEDGGDPYTVNYDGELLTSEQIPERRLIEGDVITVEDGADAEEATHEETAEIAPGVRIEKGGAIQFVSQWGKAGKKTVRVGDVSGETEDKKVVQEPSDMVVSSINPKPKKGKYVALTFDDGPSSYTQQILDILAEKGAKATFFNLGSQVGYFPNSCRNIVEGGNELASHTMRHQNLPSLDRDGLRTEITDAFSAISETSGTDTTMIRAPYGAFTDVEWGRACDLVSCNVLWNIDTLDWKLPGSKAIEQNVVDNAYNGAIVLMHDGGGDRSQDVKALPGIIDKLADEGYEFVTVTELMELDGRFPEDVVKGTVTVPDDAVMPEE